LVFSPSYRYVAIYVGDIYSFTMTKQLSYLCRFLGGYVVHITMFDVINMDYVFLGTPRMAYIVIIY
jgi:hypothetical protein